MDDTGYAVLVEAGDFLSWNGVAPARYKGASNRKECGPNDDKRVWFAPSGMKRAFTP
ncbi:MAG TPA: hypothetical protein VND65_06110 [Candidatus Binatia bacterium]|nr:hypothetical protein [Candidatus Binatia bacterium]